MRLTLEAERAANKANRINAAERQAFGWDPIQREEHCSNCRNCVVSEMDGEPMAQCEKGLGRMGGAPRPLCLLTKPSSPYSWMAAAKCPQFTCMSDDCKGHGGGATANDTPAN